MAARFQIPEIDDNEDGWGPSSASVPDKFKDIPYYAPFNKGEKLGKASDWQAQYQGKARYGQKEGSGVSTIFNWYYQDDDSSFQLVDNTKTQAKKTYGTARRYQQRGGFQQQQQQQQQYGGRGQQKNQGWQQTGRQQQQYPQQKKNAIKGFLVKPGPRWGQQDPNLRKREATIQVKEDWQLIEEIEFNTLTKLPDANEPNAEDLMSCGTLEFYNKATDRVTSMTDTILERTDRIFFNVTTSDDPIIRQLSMENRGTVFATDVILAHLMSCTKSVLPWDIIVTKVGSKIFFDKRDGSNFDYFTVNETSVEPPVEDARDPLNSASALMREATFINQNFSQQVLVREQYNFEHPNPFQSEGQEVAAVGYKYRKWNLGEGVTLVARCEVDGVASTKGKDTLLTIRALNEYDPKQTGDWRKRIDSQRAGVLATELKNNSNKLAKWTSQAILAGTDSIKLGFVSRISPKDFANHQLLGIQDYKPREFAQQISLNTKNNWAIMKRLIDLLMKQSTGKYILMKEPEKNAVKVYKVPQNAFESGNDAAEEETNE